MAKSVSSKVTINKIAIRKLEKAAITALVKTADVLQGEIRDAQVIPMKTGALRGEQFYIDDSNADRGHIDLIHSTPYARRLYFHPEYNFNREFAANAKGKWFENWIDGPKKNRAQEIYNKMYKKESGV